MISFTSQIKLRMAATAKKGAKKADAPGNKYYPQFFSWNLNIFLVRSRMRKIYCLFYLTFSKTKERNKAQVSEKGCKEGRSKKGYASVFTCSLSKIIKEVLMECIFLSFVKVLHLQVMPLIKINLHKKIILYLIKYIKY